MAKPKGIIHFTGNLGALNFYQTSESGQLVRTISSLTANRVKKDPAFANSRRASAEFGRASAAAKLLRNAMPEAGYQLSDTRIISRLTGKFTGILATDPINEKGNRSVDEADLEGLLGFAWNKHQIFGGMDRLRIQYRIDAHSGLMEIDVEALHALQLLRVPKAATHMEIVLQGAACLFSEGKSVGIEDSSGWRPVNSKEPAITLYSTVPKSGRERLVLGAGLRFGFEDNGRIYPVNDKGFKGFVIGAVV